MEIVILLLIVLSLIFVFLLFLFGNKKKPTVEVYEDIRNPFVMQILVPRENDKAALAAEQMFASIHGILADAQKCPDIISLEIVSTDEDGIRFYVVAPREISRFIEGQIYAQYPNADIRYVQDYARIESVSSESFVTMGEVEMEKDFILVRVILIV